MKREEVVTIVSGLPRSGTSMLMKMLATGGMEVLTDDIRAPDEDNPRGYLEFERVKELEEDNSWVADARGKVVKIISALLKHLPADHQYRIIFMQRKMAEILASQRQMLVRRGEPTDTVSDEKMAEMFEKHLRSTEAWLASQPNIEVLYVSYNEVLEDPAACAARVNSFLGGALDVESMARVVEPALHRQRR